MSDAQARRFGPLDIAAVIFMNLMMGTNMVAMKFVIIALGPFSTSVMRFGSVMLLCLPWIRHERHRWRLLALLGFFNGALMSCLMNLALEVSSNIGALSIVAQLSIPFSVLLSVVLLHERVTVIRLVGSALAFAGVVVMLFNPQIAHDLPGVALMTGGALSWACSSLLQRRLSGVPVLTFYAWTGLVTLVVLLPVSLIFEPHLVARVAQMPWAAAGWLVYSTVGVTLAGQGCLAWLLRHHPVSVVMPLSLVTPVVSVLSAWLFFASPITLSMAVGGGMVLGGIAIVMGLVPALTDRILGLRSRPSAPRRV
jgi:O-acetylserine/cysteine efflux transporter